MVSRYHPIDCEVKKFFFRHSKIKRCKRGDYLLKPGDFCGAYYFIYKGQVRSFIKEDGKEVITWVSVQGEIITSFYSMYSKNPSNEYLQVLTTSVILQLDSSDIEFLYKKYPHFNVVVRKLLEYYFVDAELRALITRMPDASSKYKLFAEKYPHLISDIPQKHIASFLGIRQETLSRLISSDQVS